VLSPEKRRRLVLGGVIEVAVLTHKKTNKVGRLVIARRTEDFKHTMTFLDRGVGADDLRKSDGNAGVNEVSECSESEADVYCGIRNTS
jgi:hypothetical protein